MHVRLVALIRSVLPVMAAIVTVGPTVSAANSANVLVYGSTPGGFCAAIAAAREGAAVILLEPTDHVGAMSTGGLSHCDSNQMVRTTLMGLFDEWHGRIVKDYTDRGLPAPYEPTTKDQARWMFEPHVAMRATRQMLAEADVTVLTECPLQSIAKEGPRITSLVTPRGAFRAREFVDGTYEGDLMAAAGVDWTIGREGRGEYGETLAGKQYPKQRMAIDGFDEQGDNLLVPVSLSCTHVGMSSLRIEATWMVIGQAAGVAAALAAKQDVAVQRLEYAKLRERLVAQNQVLDLPDRPEHP